MRLKNLFLITDILIKYLIQQSLTKTCPQPPGYTPPNYMEIRDVQFQIKNKLGQSGKSSTDLEEAKFNLDICNGNSAFKSSHSQIITTWVRLELGMTLSPESSISDQSVSDLLKRTATYGNKVFFDKESTISSSPINEDLTTKKIPSNGQVWIFLSFGIQKEYTDSVEYTKMFLNRGYSKSETNIQKFGHETTLLEKCTSLQYEKRGFYNPSEMAFKTSKCRFANIKELWYTHVFKQDHNLGIDFFFIWALGGKLKLQERFNFYLYEKKHLKKLYPYKLTKENFIKFLAGIAKKGRTALKDPKELEKFSFKHLRAMEDDFSGTTQPSGTTVLKIDFFQSNGESCTVKKKFNFKMKNDRIGLEEGLIEFLITFKLSKTPEGKYEIDGKAELNFYRFDLSKGNNVLGNSVDAAEQKLTVHFEETEFYFFTISVEFLPQIISSGNQKNEIQNVIYRVNVEFNPLISQEDGPQKYYIENEKILALTKVVEMKTIFDLENEFYFENGKFVKETTGDYCYYDNLIKEILHLNGAGSQSMISSSSQIPVKNTLKGTIKDTLDKNLETDCLWVSFFDFTCPMCKNGYLSNYYDEQRLKCPTRPNIKGLDLKDGCVNIFNLTHCESCSYLSGYYLDKFSRGGKCLKIAEKCPDGQGMYQPFQGYITHSSPEINCFTCPVNCKKCFYEEGEKFYFCKETFQEVEENGFNLTSDSYLEPKCKISHCGVCEREKCDRCIEGFILKIDFLDKKKEFECVLKKEGQIENPCPTGYLLAKNETNLYISDFCFTQGSPPYGYYLKSDQNVPYFKACLEDTNCEICSIYSKGTSSLLPDSDPRCSMCSTSPKKIYKSFMPAIDQDTDLCEENKSDFEKVYCSKKNLTNDCSECSTDKPNIELVRTSSFNYDCSCKEGYYYDYVHKSGCRALPHNCKSGYLDSLTKKFVCKACKLGFSWDAGGKTCGSDCQIFCSVCEGKEICKESYQGYLLGLDKKTIFESECPEGQNPADESRDECIQCPKNCKKCETSTKCLECLSGVKCFDCSEIDQCSVCNGHLNQCEKCNKGFILSKNKMKCEQEKNSENDEEKKNEENMKENSGKNNKFFIEFIHSIQSTLSLSDLTLRLSLSDNNHTEPSLTIFQEQVKLFQINETNKNKILPSYTTYNDQKKLFTFINYTEDYKEDDKISLEISLTKNTIVENLINRTEKIKIEGKLKTEFIEPKGLPEIASEASSQDVWITATLLTLDPSGILVRLSQYVSLVKRFIFLKINFGNTLTFLLEKSADVKKIVPKNRIRRLLGRYFEIQNGSKGKFDIYFIGLEFEKKLMWYSIGYLASWILVIIEFVVLRRIEKQKKISKGNRYFLAGIRKIKLTTFWICSPIISFLGMRVLLHRKGHFVAKGVLMVCIMLIIFDFILIYKNIEKLIKFQKLKEIRKKKLDDGEKKENLNKVRPLDIDDSVQVFNLCSDGK